MPRDATHWHLRMLGPPALTAGKHAVQPGRRRSLALLAYLCLHEGGVSRDGLCSLFWPDADAAAARASLRTVLSELRSILGKGSITIAGELVMLLPGVALTWDLKLLESPADKALRWSEAQWNALSGVFLEGLHFPGCEALDEWIYFQRQRAIHLLCTAMETTCMQCLADNELDKAQMLAVRWQHIDPLSESACAALLRVYLARGRVDLAQAHWVDFANRLQDELGVMPSPATRALLDPPDALQATGAAPRLTGAQIAGQSASMSEVHYVLSGTAYIAWRSITVKEDAPWLVFISGFVSHLEQWVAEPQLVAFFAGLAMRFRVIVFDKRGMGLSDRTASPPTLLETAADVLAVMNAAGAGKATLMGVSEGGPAALHCAAEHADRVERLILYGTAARWTATSDYPHMITASQYDLWLQRLQQQWGGALHLKLFAPSREGDEALVQWWSLTLRLAASPGSICAVLLAAKDFDLRPRLSDIHQPTLILHRRGDQLIRVANGEYLAARMPHASLVVLPGRDHWFWLEEPEAFLTAVDGFLGSNPRP